MASTRIGELVWKITGDTSDVDKSIKKTETGLGKFGKVVSAAFSIAAVAAFGKAIFNVAKTSVLANADLVESQNAVNVVFGEASDIITNFGEDAVNSVGLTQTAFNELSTVIGAQLKQSGLEIDTVADKTVELTQRAADTASIFNVDVNEALTAFGAALRGESEPARRFGVNISDAAVQAEALASGLVSSKNEINDQIKVQARYNLILKQSQDFAGDFANTQESFSNQLKIARANTQELAAAIGESLIPAANNAVIAFNKVLDSFIDTIERGREIKDAYKAVEDGTASLDQEILVLETRLERFASASRGAREQVQRQLDALIRQREALARYNAEQALANEAVVENTEETEENTDARNENTEAIDAQAQAELDRLETLGQLRREAGERALQDANDRVREEIELAREAAAERVRIAEQEEAAKRQAQIETATFSVSLASNTFGLLANLYGEDSKQRRGFLIASSIAERGAAAFNAFNSTQEAAAKALTLGPIAGPIFAGIIKALGLVNVGAILAQPLPKLQDGGVIPASPGGTAFIAGEAGQDEAVVPLDEAVGSTRVTVNLDGQPILDFIQDGLDNREIVVDQGSIS